MKCCQHSNLRSLDQLVNLSTRSISTVESRANAIPTPYSTTSSVPNPQGPLSAPLHSGSLHAPPICGWSTPQQFEKKKKKLVSLHFIASMIASMTIFSSLSLYYCLCRFEVTVTSVTLSPFMSHRGLVNTNQRLSLLLLTLRKLAPSYSYTTRNKTMSRIPNRQEPRQANRHRAGHAPQ